MSTNRFSSMLRGLRRKQSLPVRRRRTAWNVSGRASCRVPGWPQGFSDCASALPDEVTGSQRSGYTNE
jgi:hypothetical protein